jgi:uroporphyrinogen-III synthase
MMDFVEFVSQLYGKGTETAHKLRSAGYTTPERFSCATPQELSGVTGLPLFSSRGMVATAYEMVRQDRKGWKSRLADIEGVGERRAQKLREAGFRTVMAVAGTNEEKLARVLKVRKSTVGKIIKSARKMTGRVSGARLSAQEPEIAHTKVFSGASTRKGKSKEPPQSVESFWNFG